jgi:DNA-binding response OmpR family regulator
VNALNAPEALWSEDSQPRVLIVEDDEAISKQLVRGLSLAGYEATAVSTGQAALRAAPADVVVLDLGLPDMDGIGLCSQLRARSDVAIIVVTARDEEADRVLALDRGADDYIVKPFGRAELLARIRAVLRRTRAPGTELLRHGDLEVDIRTCKVTLGGLEIELTRKEFDILACLMADPGRVMSRQQILEQAWDAHWYGPMKVLDVHVASLRKKLGVPGLIETVYGRGFRLADQP